MLTKIVIKNFKSFKDETIIDFTRTNYKVLEDNVTGHGVLKGAMFVGANASGKSNTLFAIRFLLDELFLDTINNAHYLRCLFSKDQEFSIHYYFLIEDKEIIYRMGFDIKQDMLFEKLFIDNELMIERIGSNAKSYITDKVNFDGLDKEILFLRTIYFNTGFANHPILHKWFIFLQNSIYFNAFEKQVVSYGKKDFRILNYVKEHDTTDINTFMKMHYFDQSIEYASESGNKDSGFYAMENMEKYLFFKRKDVDIPIPYQYESFGNRTFLNMLPAFLYVVKNNGMLLIDEFSSGFHNELERLLVRYFMDTATASQMIFVSHSTNLLSTSILRPDQVYAVEFNGMKGSQLKRFSEEQPRVSQNLEKMYLGGVFGGLPNYKEAYED